LKKTPRLADLAVLSWENVHFANQPERSTQ